MKNFLVDFFDIPSAITICIIRKNNDVTKIKDVFFNSIENKI